MPQITIGNRRYHLNKFFRNRMYKTDPTCMQANASIGIGTRKAILQVTTDGTAHLSQLATNLMMASGLQIDFKQTVIVRTPYQAIVQNGFLAAGLL